MRKILLGIILLGLVIGVSYLKNVRALERDQEATEEGRLEAQTEIAEQVQQVDSLKVVLGEKEVEHANAMTSREVEHSSEVDSLYDVIEAQEKKLAAEPKPASTQMPATEKKRQPTLEEKVLSHYKKQYQTLPQDLSSYERKIALGELREETAAEFKISLEKLHKIRKDNNLTY